MKLNGHSRVGAIATLGVLALTLAACGSDDATSDTNEPTSGTTSAPASDLKGDLAGAGASSQEKAMGAWIAQFQDQNPDVSVSYDPQGSGAGRTQFLEGGVLFAGTDSAMKADELTKATDRCFGGEAYDLPIYISPIAVIYNLPSVSELNLSPATIAGIFNNTITTWDAPEIAADNPGVELPSSAITPVHRGDESGTTNNFTDYLKKAAGDAWPYDPSGTWPVEGGQSGQQTSGLIQTVQAAEGTIGYADFSAVGSLGVAKIKVGDEYVAPSAEGAAAVVADSPRDDSRSANDIVVKLDRATTDPTHYPLVLVSYQVVCSQYDSEDDADLVKAFVGYVASAEGQQAAVGAAGNAPISDALRSDIQAALDSIKASA